MDIIKTKAVDPRPVRVEGSVDDTEEIFIFDKKGIFIGTEYRLNQAALDEIAGEIQ